MDNRTIQIAIQSKAKLVYADAITMFKIQNPAPMKHDFSLRGRVGGTSQYLRTENTGKLRWNVDMASKNFETYMADVIIHELAHLVCSQVYPFASAHGREWKYIMVKMGAEPKRCHNMEYTPARATTKVYETHCNCQTHKVTKLVYERVANSQSYTCRKCKAKLKIGSL